MLPTPKTLLVNLKHPPWFFANPYARSIAVMTSRLLRSALYIPAIREKAVAKAASLGADAVIFDLEDSVAPDAKEAARTALQNLPSMSSTLGVIRINASGTPWHENDVAAAARLPVHAILLPKANGAEDVAALKRLVALQNPRANLAIWAMIETAKGVLNAPALAQAVGPDGVLVMGLNDLAKETGMAQTAGRLPMQHALSASVLAARAAGAGILDGVFNMLDDAAGFAAECQQGRDSGFDGKTLIHPAQIEAANTVFGPSSDEIEAAQQVVDAFALHSNAGKGVIALNGKMVERLHHAMALAVLEKAAMIQKKGH
jgi:citrate lyase beta subunit